MQDACTRINTILLLPSDLNKEIVALSKRISQQTKAYFVLDDINYFPHITLYSPEYPDSSLGRIFLTTEEIARQIKPFEIIPKRFNTQDGYIDIELDLSAPFNELHRAVVNKLNPLRENHVRQKYQSPLSQSLDSLQIKNIKQFGEPNINDAYRAHITIIRIIDSVKANKMLKTMIMPFRSINISSIANCEMGENGTCTRILKEYALGQ